MRIPLIIAASIFFGAFIISFLTAWSIGTPRAMKQYLSVAAILLVFGFPAIFLLTAGLAVFALDIIFWVYFLLFSGVIIGALLGGTFHNSTTSVVSSNQSNPSRDPDSKPKAESSFEKVSDSDNRTGLETTPPSQGKKSAFDFIPSFVVLALVIVPIYLFIGKDYWQPDVNVDYQFELHIPDGQSISFSGSTGCAYRRNNLGDFRYRTINPTFEIENGDTWTVTGIDCTYFMDNTYYNLKFYKQRNSRLSEVYFPNQFNQVVNFDTKAENVSIPDDIEPNFHKTFENGPFVYRISKLREIPDFASSLESNDPVLLVSGTACSSHIAEGSGIEVPSINKDREQVESYSTGVLSFDLETNAWVIGNPIDPSIAPIAGDQSTILSTGCIEVEIDEIPFVLGTRGANAVYFPGENRVLHVEVMNYGRDGRNPYSNTIRWRPCEIDTALTLQMLPGEIYVDIERFKYYSRNTPQGVECASTVWPYL